MRINTSALLIALLVGVSACGGPTGPVNEQYESLPADQVTFGVEHTITVSGVRQALLRSDTVLMYNDSSMVHLRGVNLDIYTEDGALRATLTSLSGELDNSTRRMIARGNVVLVVQGPQGRTVWTEELHYDPQQKRIWSDVRTRTRTARGDELTGDGFTSDEQFQNFDIRAPRGSGLRIEF
jgi:LPS export ABC transporter protein LptC